MSKILVVDDSRLSRNMAADSLTSAGYLVVEAANGQEGLAMLDEHRPDCVVIDLLMPVMNGLELLRQLRDNGADVPVIVATSDIQDGSRAECEALGIYGFLNKPVKREKLVSGVQEALSQIQGTTP